MTLHIEQQDIDAAVAQRGVGNVCTACVIAQAFNRNFGVSNCLVDYHCVLSDGSRHYPVTMKDADRFSTIVRTPSNLWFTLRPVDIELQP